MKNGNFDHLSSALNDLLDERFGIIHKISEYRSLTSIPLFYFYDVFMCDTKAFCGYSNFRNSRGVAINKDRALAKAIGEGIERYCSAIYNKNDLPYTSYRNANFNCINPSNFLTYSPSLYKEKKFAWNRFNRTTKVRWTKAIDLTNKNTSINVPAAYVYLPYVYGETESRIIQNISTGLAFHSSLEMAKITSILEVIERDSFMIFWRNKMAPPKIRICSLPDYIQCLIHRYNSTFQNLTLFDITTDIKIPTVLAVLRSTAIGNPGLIISASCKTSPEQAIISAIEEVELTRVHCIDFLQSMALSNVDKTCTEFKNQKDHLLFWYNQQNSKFANFLFDSHIEVEMKDMANIGKSTYQEELNLIIQLLSDLDYQILIANITTSDIAWYNLHVVRAIIPQLHPLSFGYTNQDFICDRLKSVPKKLGIKIKKKLNTNQYIPHPFP